MLSRQGNVRTSRISEKDIKFHVQLKLNFIFLIRSKTSVAFRITLKSFLLTAKVGDKNAKSFQNYGYCTL